MEKSYWDKQEERRAEERAAALDMVKVAAEHGLTVKETLNAADYAKLLAQNTIVALPDIPAD